MERPTLELSEWPFSEVDQDASHLLDKLAQLATTGQSEQAQGFEAIQTTYQKRARAKMLTGLFVPALIDLNTTNKEKYERSIDCSAMLFWSDTGGYHSRYCNGRFCIVCARIRTGKAIQGYFEELQGLASPYFVTLTAPTIESDKLEDRIKQMAGTLNSFRKQRIYRGNPVTGIRKLECTYRPERNHYHPHYHLIVDGANEAQHIRDYWLKHIEGTSTRAQDVRKADLGSMKELFKYFTKVHKFNPTSGKYEIYLKPFDRILTAMNGKRVFQPFGRIKKQIAEEDIGEGLEVQQGQNKGVYFAWDEAASDWLDSDGQAFAEYLPDERTQQFVSKLVLI